MSYYSDLDDCFAYNISTFDDYNVYFYLLWNELKLEGYLWQDVEGKRYKAKNITNKHLKNIIKYCKKSFRPEEQVKALKNLAKERKLFYITH